MRTDQCGRGLRKLECFLNANWSKTRDIAGPHLPRGRYVGRNHRRDLGKPANGRILGTHDDRFNAAWTLDAANGDDVINDVGWIRARVAHQVVGSGSEFEFRAVKSSTRAIRLSTQLPCFGGEIRDALVGEGLMLRSHNHA